MKTTEKHPLFRCAPLFLGVLTLAAAAQLTAVPNAHAQLTLLDQFNPGEVGGIVGAGFDSTTDLVWVYEGFAGAIHSYTRTGTFVGSVNRPGESANDADLEFTPAELTLGTNSVAPGTLLMINGESDSAEVHAVDKASGTVLATRTTSFGVSHVVGGAYHAGRGTFFLVQDRVPSGTANDSVVAEVSPVDGSVLNSFKIDSLLPEFTVNYGDIDVNNLTGNLLIVSSDETSIAEFTPAGEFLRTLPLPAGVGELSGIALDERRGEAWVTSNEGVVYRLGNVPGAGCPSPVVQLVSSQVEICWPSESNAVYHIEYRSDLLAGTWAPLFTNLVATGQVMCVTDPAASGPSPQRFYRLACPIP